MIVFYNQISKSKPNYNQFIKRIRKLIDKQQPQLVFLLAKEWQKQQNYFTYKDIRQGLLDGSLTDNMIRAWQDSYTQFISTHLAPIWEQAMNDAAKQISNKYTSFSFNPTTANIRNWTTNHAGELIIQLTDTQAKGINSLIQMAATTGMSVDELAKCIRPTVGLYSGQMTANFNYYQSVKNNLLKNNPHMTQSTAIKIASEKALKYAEKQHMYRAMNIARTELAFAYNRGEFESAKQAVQQGYMGHTVKRWITAGDNRVCPICRSLEGEEAELEAEYNIKSKSDGLTPPAHPSCRCCLEYFEVEPPNKIIVNNNVVDEAPQLTAQTFNEVYEENISTPAITPNIQTPNFLIHLIEDYDNVPLNTQVNIEHDLNLIPQNHRDILLSEVKRFIVDGTGNSRYDRANKTLYIREEFMGFELIHELGHAIETRLDFYNNPKYLAIRNNGLENVTTDDITEVLFDSIIDGEVKEITVKLLDPKNSKFISDYQQMLYKKDLEGKDRIIGDKINLNTLGEYFSEGYREYFEDPNNLKIKDIKLYNFIKELKL